MQALIASTADRDEMLFSVPHCHAPFGQSIERYQQELGRWVQNFRSARLDAVNFGYILVWRASGEHQSVTQRVIHNPSRPMHAEVSDWRAQQALHASSDADAHFLCLHPDARFTHEHAPGGSSATYELSVPTSDFFTTYALLVLFWAEIYHQARSFPTGALRPTFVGVNALVYAFQGSLWTWEGAQPKVGAVLEKVSALFLAFVCAVAAAGFVVYGGRLFAMLRSFPAESRGRQKKLREVGAVTAVCATCFTVRAVMVCTSAFAETKDGLDVMNHPVRNALYYAYCEIAPSALVLFILRKLPPRTRRADERRTPRRERRGRDRGEVHGDDERREPLLGDEEEGRVRGRHRRNRD